jgi:tyrosyl-DNA phosphodiesterase-1
MNLIDCLLSEPGICVNYMHDLDWLGSESPTLKSVPLALLYHSVDGDIGHWPKISLHKPLLPPFGTHHTKCLVLVSKDNRMLRFCVQTANNLYTDNFQLTDAVWVQDFPCKQEPHASVSRAADDSKCCQFEDDLVDYLHQSGWKGMHVAGLGRVDPDTLRAFDFRAARAVLIPSVPGAHTGAHLHRYGHMRLRAALGAQRFPARFAGADMVWQATSIGSLSPPWLSEFRASLSAGRAYGPTAAPLGPPRGPSRLVWPTMEEVRGSRLGWSMGGSIPGARDKVARLTTPEAAALVQLCRWDGAGWGEEGDGVEGRGRSMPHIKTYLRHAGDGAVAWALLGSHNLSAAAWGKLERGGAQLRIRSYELSVLLLPSLIPPPLDQPPGDGARCGRSSGGSTAQGGGGCEPGDSDGGGTGSSRLEFVTTAAVAGRRAASGAASGATSGAAINVDADGGVGRVALPLPYRLPPVAYVEDDTPWMWDSPLLRPDDFGRTFPRGLIAA